MIDASASILVCPDSLKESLSATAAAAAIAAGVREVLPDARVRTMPLADGGEGTLEVLKTSIPTLEMITTEVSGPRPDRDRVTARVGIDIARRLGVVELAEAAGLALLSNEDRDPELTGTEGVGALLEFVLHRLRAEASSNDVGRSPEILVALGGSATVDGGLGALRSLGIELAGSDLDPVRPLVGGDLSSVTEVRVPDGLRRAWGEITLRILADVRHPLLGPNGAASTFGPQKGASSAGVRRLDVGLSRWGELLAARYGVDPMAEGAGAAGGIGLALAATLGGVIERGFEAVAVAVGLEEAIAESDLVLTSEGRLDPTSFEGKVVGGVVHLAERHGVPVAAVPGAVANGLDAGRRARFAGVRSLIDEVGSGLARGETAEGLRLATRAVVRGLS